MNNQFIHSTKPARTWLTLKHSLKNSEISYLSRFGYINFIITGIWCFCCYVVYILYCNQVLYSPTQHFLYASAFIPAEIYLYWKTCFLLRYLPTISFLCTCVWYFRWFNLFYLHFVDIHNMSALPEDELRGGFEIGLHSNLISFQH